MEGIGKSLKQTGIFGSLVRDIRETKGITKEKLARGICTVKALEKYEGGEREPEKLTADALLTRLKKSMEKFESILGDGEYDKAAQRMEIQRLLREGKLEKAEKAIAQYGKTDEALHYQYACFLRAELLRKKNASVKEQMGNVVDGIYQTLETRKERGIREVTPEEKTGDALKWAWLSERCFSKMELCLWERYAILLEESGKQEEALLWYQAITRYLDDEDYDRADQYTLYPIMDYKLAEYYERQCLYDPALDYIAHGCEMLRERKEQLALFCRLMELKFKIEDRQREEEPKDKDKNKDMVQDRKDKERAQYQELLCSVAQEGEDWRENWYPMYKENHLICFNDLIRERRWAKGMSKEELAYGIFDVRSLERMEANQNTPRAKTREKLLQKLGLPLEKYNAGIIVTKYGDYRKVAQMERLCQQGEYRGAREIYRELKKGIDMKNLTNQQWAEYWDIRIMDGLKYLPPEDRKERLWVLFRKTVPIREKGPQLECQLMRNERYILEQLLETAEQDERLHKFLLRQIQIYYQVPKKKFLEPDYLIQLFLYLGNLNGLKGQISLALRYLHMAEKRMVANDEWNAWEYILYRKQLIKDEMGTEKDGDTLSCAQQAFAVSCIYAKNQKMMDYLLWKYEIVFWEEDEKGIIPIQ